MGSSSSKKAKATIGSAKSLKENGSKSSVGERSKSSKPHPPVKRASKVNASKFFTSGVSGGYKMGRYSQEIDLEQETDVYSALRGILPDGAAASNSKIVRIFVSSTFTDTKNERNALMETTYPKLKHLCQSLGYQFQVIDMRWGIRSEATDDHETVALCLEQVKNCCLTSTGPAFFTLLGQKYGYRPIPSKIEEMEFQKLMKNVKSSDDIELLNSWYLLDVNNVPPQYVLQPITSHFPDFTNDTDADKKIEATEAWNKEFSKLQLILRNAAKSLKESSDRAKYFVSVTALEVDCGITNSSDVLESCIWVHRNITDLKEHVGQNNVRRYIDVVDNQIDEEAQYMLSNLKKDILYKKLSYNNIEEYDVQWSEGGIDLSNPSHKSYIEKVCGDVYDLMSARISTAIELKESRIVKLPCFEESIQHLCFARDKCDAFYGRKDQLDAVESYLKEDEAVGPLVVHGESGSGKTSVVAQASRLTFDWLGENANVIVRFLGTTPASSHVRLLLDSICHQISVLYSLQYDLTIKRDIKQLKEELISMFSKVSSNQKAKHPLVVYLDSLDQLAPDDGALQLGWLPKHLPKHIKIIVSTIPGEEYVCLPILKDLLDEEYFVEVPNLPQSDADQILGQWLAGKNRTITDFQRKMVLKSFEKCSLPIFLKVAFDEATRWRSYTVVEDIVLKKTVRGAIDSLFERIERDHGKCLVEHALGYITVSKSGLTENELEDILSCDDDVLEDVFQHWVPPIRRIPTLLWVRIRSELASYLVDRGADDASVITWYHRQFLEAAQDRYLSDQNRKKTYATRIADYFLSIWADGKKKPYIDRHGDKKEANRLPTHQPLVYKTGLQPITSFNERKLSELPHALICARDLHRIKSDCLCNYEYLLTLLQARSARDIADNLELALEAFPGDPDLRLVLETLHLSSNALSLWPGQLATQLVARLQPESFAESQYLQVLLKDARRPSCPAFISDKVCLTSPGGPLLHALSGLKEPSNVLKMMSNMKNLISVAEGGVNIWDISKGKLSRTVEVDVGTVLDVATSTDNRYMVLSSGSQIQGWLFSTGQPLYSLSFEEERLRICLTEFYGRAFIVATNHRTLKLIYLDTGEEAYNVNFGNLKSEQDVLVSALGTTAVRVALDVDYTVAVYNLNARSVINTYTMEKSVKIVSLDLVYNNMILFATLPADVESSGRRASVISNLQSKKLELWQSSDGTPEPPLVDADSSVRCHCISPDLKLVAVLVNSRFVEQACSFEATVMLISLVDRTVDSYLLSYPSTINHIACAGPGRFITSSLDKSIRIWNLNLLASSADGNTRANELDFAAPIIFSDFLLAFGCSESAPDKHFAYLYNMKTNNCVLISCNNNSEALFMSDKLVLILSGRELQSYELPNGKFIHSVEVDINQSGSNRLFRLTSEDFIVVARRRKTFNVFSGPRLSMKKAAGLSKDVDILRIVSCPSASMFFICVLGPVDESLPISARGCFVYIYSSSTFEEIKTISYSPYISTFSDLTLTDKGNNLCDVVYDPYVKKYRAGIWDTGTARLTFLSDTTSPAHIASLSPSGRIILCALWDGSILVYDLLKGGPLWHRTCHIGSIHRVFLSKDSRMCATIAGGLNSRDRSVRLWNTFNGEKIAEFTADVKISSIVFTADLRTMALQIQNKLVIFELVGYQNDKDKAAAVENGNGVKTTQAISHTTTNGSIDRTIPYP